MKVTAIVCVHRELSWLKEALASIAGQTSPVDELLVVVSGETPPEVSALTGLARIIRQDKPGLAAARNAGIQEARGSVIAFLDSDDLWDKNKIANQLPCIDLEGWDVVTGLLKRFTGSAEVPAPYDLSHFKEWIPALTPGGLLVRKIVFQQLGLFDTRYQIACDHEWFMRLTDSDVRWKKTTDKVLHKRIHEGNLSNRISVYRREIMMILKERHNR